MALRISCVSRLIAALIISVAALVPLAAAAQSVTIERDSPLRTGPRLDAPVAVTVKQGTQGTVSAKQGVWLQVNTAAGSGWLFSFNVRFASTRTEAGGSSGAGGAASRLVGPRRDVSVTATIGIRGLDEEDMRQARFDGAQLTLLDGYTATREASESRAAQAGLEAVRVDYFDGSAP
jgi:hypothetical protein